MVTRDPYTDWDAAYVLGALPAAERQEYEAHLGTCLACRDAVAELSGLPGLLAQVPMETALSAGGPVVSGTGPAPSAGALHPAPLGASPEAKMRAPRRWRATLAAAAAALVIGIASGYAGARFGPAEPAAPPGATAVAGGRLAFSAVGPSPMTAVVDVEQLGAGTRLKVECQYATAGWEQSADARYAVWVVGRDGSAREEFVWKARPGVVMHPTATSALPPAQIATVEIRRADTGEVLLRTRLA